MIKKTGRELYGFQSPRIPVRAFGKALGTIVGAAPPEKDRDDIFVVELPDAWGKSYKSQVWGRHLSELRDDFVALLFDTETDGLPKAWNKNSIEVDNWPHIVEISAKALRFTRGDCFPEEVGSLSSIIYPDGFEIPEDVSKVHGITTEKARAEGRPILEVLSEFQALADEADAIVAHNLDFDIKVAEAAFYREKLTPYISDMLPICTMKTTKNLVKAPNARGGFKRPKLSELHSHLFGFEFEGAHRSGADTDALVACFVELLSRNHFKETFFKEP